MTLVGPPPTENRFLITVDWEGYTKILEALADRRVRASYDNGVLELMTLSPEHERLKSQLGHLLEAAMLFLEIDFVTGGSTTFRRQALEKGLEPDECYWIQNLAAAEDVADYDPEHGVPPDVCVEIEVSRSSVDRRGIYAALGVPELWCYGQDHRLRVFGLISGAYQELERSRCLPEVPIADLARHLEQGRKRATSKVVRAFQRFLAERR